jgi:hypothetical protein
MTPDFTLLLVGGMVFAVAVLGFIGGVLAGRTRWLLVSSRADSQRSWIFCLHL